MLVLFVDDFTRTCQKQTQSHPTLKKVWYFKNIYLAKKYIFHIKLKPNDENFFQCSHGVDLFAKKKETVGCQRKNLIMGDIEISFAQKISSVSISSCFNFLFFCFSLFCCWRRSRSTVVEQTPYYQEVAGSTAAV